MSAPAAGSLRRRRVVPRGAFDLVAFEGGDPDGPTLVMVHGWPDTHRMWQGVARELESELRLVAYDTRGQGDSVTRAPDSAFTLDALADDLFAVIDAVSPDEPVHVVGHDWGSVQACRSSSRLWRPRSWPRSGAAPRCAVCATTAPTSCVAAVGPDRGSGRGCRCCSSP